MLLQMFLKELTVQHHQMVLDTKRVSDSPVKNEEMLLSCLDKKDSAWHLRTIPSCKRYCTIRQKFDA